MMLLCYKVIGDLVVWLCSCR